MEGVSASACEAGRNCWKCWAGTLRQLEDVKDHMEEIRIHLRGHNLYDIYYGRYKEQEQEILSRYIDQAPREDFADILDSIDRFIYFESRKKEGTD